MTRHSHRTEPSAAHLALIAACTLLLSGCAAQLCPPRHALVRQPAMSCSELNQATAAAAKRMGYNIESFNPAAAGKPGKMQAVKQDYDDSRTVMTVDLRCSSDEAVADAVSTHGCAGQINFPNEFQQSFQVSVAKKVERVSLVPKEEQPGLRIDVEPQRDDKGLGVSLGAANLMPVKVTINNRTARVYRLDDGGITLTSQDGAKVEPVSAADAAKRLASAKPAEGTEAQRVLRERGLEPSTIEANGKVEGYLYVPRQAYKRATVRLIDLEAEEPEGFTIEF